MEGVLGPWEVIGPHMRFGVKIGLFSYHKNRCFWDFFSIDDLNPLESSYRAPDFCRCRFFHRVRVGGSTFMIRHSSPELFTVKVTPSLKNGPETQVFGLWRPGNAPVPQDMSLRAKIHVIPTWWNTAGHIRGEFEPSRLPNVAWNSLRQPRKIPFWCGEPW